MHGNDLLAALWFYVPAYVANIAPVLVQGRLEWLAAPMDGGRSWRGRRVLGDHKTWRGLMTGVLAGTVAFALQAAGHRAGVLSQLAWFDYDRAGLLPGVLLSAGALLGDALKSFLKRQLDIAPGASWLGPDQLDFFVGAYLCVAIVWVPPLLPSLAIAPLVFAGTILTTATGYGLGLKTSWI